MRHWFGSALLAAAALATGLVATEAPFFTTGQAADLMLSGYGINRTGGALRFNHPGGVAVVEGHLALADRNNNRVLIWEGVPAHGDAAPALVLGQDGFDTNAPGSGLDGLNWPTALAGDGTRLYVADTYNDRVLVWRSRPTTNRQPADFALTRASGVAWPWGIWTDGRRLAVSATAGGRVLIWNRIPDSDQPPDLELRIPEFGTPRTIESDGTRLLVSDHNARVNGAAGNFLWSRFPESGTQSHDAFMAAMPQGGGPATGTLVARGEHIHDALALPDGRWLALFNRTLCVWSSFPQTGTEPCAVVVGSQQPGTPSGAFTFEAGDNSGLAVHDGRLFVSLNNGNRVLVFDRVPESPDERPSFAIGSPGVGTNTLETDSIITNGVPATDGERLWITSDFDRKLYAWRSLPTSSAQPPDSVMRLDFAPWASARVGEGLVLAGSPSTVAIWRQPPEGQPADVVLRDQIGGMALGELRGVAFDGTNFFLASYDKHRVWAWRGIPTAEARPFAEIEVQQAGRLSSDGRYLAVTTGAPGGGVFLYDIARLGSGEQARITIGQGLRMNLPQGVTLAGGGLFVADTNSNRVLAWRDVADAAAGLPPTAALGAPDLQPRQPAIGPDTLFWPGAVAYDGARLWVGEFKFSNRVLRFSMPEAGGATASRR